MKKKFTKLRKCYLFATYIFLVAQQAIAAGQFPDSHDKPTNNWKGQVFELSQQYPDVLPQPESLPWANINPKERPEEYLRAVLKYVFEGNEQVDWNGAKNNVRKWYNAPWLHWGRNGREFVHGLTYERVALPGELATTQTQSFQNWAIGFYNPIGAYTIGKVWSDPNKPDPNKAVFNEGTVSFKLLFTQATIDQVPYLKDAKVWDANIYASISTPTNPNAPKEVHQLRLLQLDVAIKDRRASETGWVFGTFVYNGLLPGDNLYSKLIPVGVMWGNDPDLTVRAARLGSTPKQQWINQSLDLPFQHLGYAGRLNGPVDNPNSSCTSCHSVAQWPPAPLIPDRTLLQDSTKWMQWFRNIKGGVESFSANSTSLDYSLQLMAGIANFHEWDDQTKNRGGYSSTQVKPQSQEMMPNSFDSQVVDR